MFYLHNDTVICSCKKAGSTSIHHAMQFVDHKQINAREALKHKTRVAFIRDPLERVDSVFNHFTHLARRDIDCSSHIADGIITGSASDYQQFIDYVLDNNDGHHWTPQTDALSIGDEFIPTDCFLFEQIREIWPVYVEGAMPWLNSWTQIKHEKYRVDELKNYYHRDLELRSAL